MYKPTYLGCRTSSPRYHGQLLTWDVDFPLPGIDKNHSQPTWAVDLPFPGIDKNNSQPTWAVDLPLPGIDKDHSQPTWAVYLSLPRTTANLLS